MAVRKTPAKKETAKKSRTVKGAEKKTATVKVALKKTGNPKPKVAAKNPSAAAAIRTIRSFFRLPKKIFVLRISYHKNKLQDSKLSSGRRSES